MGDPRIPLRRQIRLLPEALGKRYRSRLTPTLGRQSWIDVRICSVVSPQTYRDDKLITFARCACAAPAPRKCYNALCRGEEAAMRAVWYDRQGAADEVLVCGELP